MQSSLRRNSVSKFSLLQDQIQSRMSSSLRGRDYKSPCLTLQQPWASLLVHGIKRVEGRTWTAPIRGRLWIHAAAKVPDSETINSMQDFYKEIYAVDGITDIKFPEHYPVSKLLGCVDVVGCVSRKELIGWDAIPEGVRLEGQTDFCWLCENPQKLIMPLICEDTFRVYNLETKVHDQAVPGLRSVKIPSPVKFHLPDPQDPFSLKPGSLLSSYGDSFSSGEKPVRLYSKIASEEEDASFSSEKQEKLDRVIAGAQMKTGRCGRRYKNPCLTLHQPWASLLTHGIKRIEGRSWTASIRGRLWIHSSAKVPDSETIKSMEDFYKEIYAVDGITDIKFPEYYPVSKLLGCVDVVGCVSRKELLGWDAISEGVRLEGQTDFCWLCENPQKLIMPLMCEDTFRVYDLETKVHNQAVLGLRSVKIPSPVKFHLPDPQDPFSLKPGSVLSHGDSSSSGEHSVNPYSQISSEQEAPSSSSSEKQEDPDTVIAAVSGEKSLKPYSAIACLEEVVEEEEDEEEEEEEEEEEDFFLSEKLEKLKFRVFVVFSIICLSSDAASFIVSQHF